MEGSWPSAGAAGAVEDRGRNRAGIKVSVQILSAI